MSSLAIVLVGWAVLLAVYLRFNFVANGGCQQGQRPRQVAAERPDIALVIQYHEEASK